MIDGTVTNCLFHMNDLYLVSWSMDIFSKSPCKSTFHSLGAGLKQLSACTRFR